jgi:membrane protease YdiL (CAAX protease family)
MSSVTSPAALAPSRAQGFLAAAIPCALIALDHVGEAVHIPRGAHLVVLAAAVVAAAGVRAWEAAACALLFFFLRSYWLVAPSALHGLPSVSFLLPFLATAAVVRAVPAARGTLRWFRRGEVDRVAWAIAIGSSVVATTALLLWAYWTQYFGVASRMMQGFAAIPAPVLVPLLGVFALVNAFSEEVVWRGVVQEALARGIRSPWIVVPLQAASFALAHFEAGFPNGKLGYAMVFTWALSLGYLRIRTRGMLAPWVTHVLADATIALVLYSHVA